MDSIDSINENIRNIRNTRNHIRLNHVQRVHQINRDQKIKCNFKIVLINLLFWNLFMAYDCFRNTIDIGFVKYLYIFYLLLFFICYSYYLIIINLILLPIALQADDLVH